MNQTADNQRFELALIQGDLSRLSPEETVSYYNKLCESLGLNPLTQPFAQITFNGRKVLYAKKDCTDQLRRIHSVSIKIVGRETVGDLCIVTASASTADGRQDEAIGAINVANLKGEALANALMKAESKAKRRVTLSICGLGLLDESEAQELKDAPPVNNPIAELRQSQAAAPSEYMPTFGKFKGMALSACQLDGPDGLAEYAKLIRASTPEPKPQVAEFLEKIDWLLVKRNEAKMEQEELKAAEAFMTEKIDF
jgi:hypothetical protein